MKIYTEAEAHAIIQPILLKHREARYSLVRFENQDNVFGLNLPELHAPSSAFVHEIETACAGKFKVYYDEISSIQTWKKSPELPPLDKGIKHDQDKIQMDLLSARWLFGVGRVLTFGARKYNAHNWRKGISRSRLLAAALRHVLAYQDGEDFDSETGLLHLFHASCCLMFASELHETRPDTDDRYKETKQ